MVCTHYTNEESLVIIDTQNKGITHFADDDTIALIAKLEAENAALRHKLQEANNYANRMADEKHIALSECEALRRDAERYRESANFPDKYYRIWNEWFRSAEGKEQLDDAIDAAMKEST